MDERWTAVELELVFFNFQLYGHITTLKSFLWFRHIRHVLAVWYDSLKWVRRYIISLELLVFRTMTERVRCPFFQIYLLSNYTRSLFYMSLFFLLSFSSVRLHVSSNLPLATIGIFHHLNHQLFNLLSINLTLIIGNLTSPVGILYV